jgi:hypothetical protein
MTLRFLTVELFAAIAYTRRANAMAATRALM